MPFLKKANRDRNCILHLALLVHKENTYFYPCFHFVFSIELTLPKSFSDQSTLPLPPNSNGESSTSSGVSSQSSGSSPVFPENGNGAAESGVFPTASAKMRRRNENAARLTSEIMQETGPAMENFKDAFHNIRTQQVQGDMLSANGRIQSPPRFRLDSQDSGRGDSCRNSIRTECEQVGHVIIF